MERSLLLSSISGTWASVSTDADTFIVPSFTRITSVSQTLSPASRVMFLQSATMSESK